MPRDNQPSEARRSKDRNGNRPRPDRAKARQTIHDIAASYRDLVTRVYARIRFMILRQPFLEEIGQYLPERGHVLDLGCGFGLFSLYFAALAPGLRIVGVDLNRKRIELATTSAQQLGIENVTYEARNVLEWNTPDRFDAIYFLDLVHHLPYKSVPEFLEKVSSLLRPGGTLVVKEVADRPVFKMLFTLILDRLMVGFEPVHYWDPDELVNTLERLGFQVRRHRMTDILPYPHILYIATATDT